MQNNILARPENELGQCVRPVPCPCGDPCPELFHKWSGAIGQAGAEDVMNRAIAAAKDAGTIARIRARAATGFARAAVDRALQAVA